MCGTTACMHRRWVCKSGAPPGRLFTGKHQGPPHRGQDARLSRRFRAGRQSGPGQSPENDRFLQHQHLPRPALPRAGTPDARSGIAAFLRENGLEFLGLKPSPACSVPPGSLIRMTRPPSILRKGTSSHWTIRLPFSACINSGYRNRIERKPRRFGFRTPALCT